MEDRVVCTCLDITYNTIKEAIENGEIDPNNFDKDKWSEEHSVIR